MSSTEETSELKAGHPPAVKAGGMRIARNRQSSTGDSKDAAPASSDPEDQPYSTTPTKQEKHSQKVLISGVVTSGDKDYKADALKQYHDKPLVSKEKSHVSTPHNIHQPR